MSVKIAEQSDERKCSKSRELMAESIARTPLSPAFGFQFSVPLTLEKKMSRVTMKQTFATVLLLSIWFFPSFSLVAQDVVGTDDYAVSIEFVLPETAFSDSYLIELTADWDDGAFVLAMRVGDPILDKAGNTAPTGTSIPTGPTYDPTTGPHKPPKYWEPIDHTKIPVIRGGTTFDAGNSLNTDPTTGNVIPNDQDPTKPKSPKGPSVNTDPTVPAVVNNPNIIV